MSRHPSEWWTTTLLAHYGPRDRTHYDVLQAIDSFDRGDNAKSYRPTLEHLAERARMAKSTMAAALAELEAEGWVTVAHGRGRGNRNHYRVNRERLERAALADRKGPATGLFSSEEPEEKVRPPELLGAEKVRYTDVKGPATGPRENGERGDKRERHHHQGPTSPTSPTAVPADDDAARALDGIPKVHPSRDVRAAINDAMGRGWTPATLSTHLRANWGNPSSPMGLLRSLLADLPTPPATKPTRAEVPWCGECDADGYRWLLDADGNPIRRCPTCNTSAPDYNPTDHAPRGEWVQGTAMVGITGGGEPEPPPLPEVDLTEPVDDYDLTRINPAAVFGRVASFR